MGIQKPIKVVQTTVYGEEDPEFMGDSSWVGLSVYWENGGSEHFLFEGSYDGKAYLKNEGMIDAFLLVNPDLELVRLKKNES